MTASADRALRTPLPLQIYALTAAAFAIGTTEFVIMGLLPEIAMDLQVSIPAAGFLVAGYALGVAVGAPILTLGTLRLERKSLLLSLMGLFIAGNVIAAVAPSYTVLMIARVVAALCHGTFFGVGAVVAASLVAAERQASAIALMFTGLALANILGVPGGTAVGQMFGWRATFWCVSAIGGLATVAIALLIRPMPAPPSDGLASEFTALRSPGLWMALGTTVFGFGGVFVILTFIAPILRDATGMSPDTVAIALLVFGAGLTLGNPVGGRLADRALMPSLIAILVALSLIQLLFGWAMFHLTPTYLLLFCWGVAAFATIAPLQTRVVLSSPSAPALASSLNIAGFNLGNAGGAAVGGALIDHGFGFPALAVAGAAMTACGLALAIGNARLQGG
ncbi:MAG: MFS transporter [Chelatococcus sp.]|uniref:MFS transporter n=1 Tax=Chelatococcus sp. TaxID=1953771 RepID=UPI0025C3A15E|nr:MFS transporter [Chelatococcus sp.]MBX3537736.1 MFS transporter [Chelatococcus sp.]